MEIITQQETKKDYKEILKHRLSILKSKGMHTENIDLEFLIKLREFGCHLCGTKKPGGRGDFHIDHDHRTNKFRGFLCSDCNTGLGHFKDSKELLERAIRYLNESKDNM